MIARLDGNVRPFFWLLCPQIEPRGLAKRSLGDVWGPVSIEGRMTDGGCRHDGSARAGTTRSPADSGRGVARLPVKLMAELGLSEGDVIEIVGKRSTAARAIRPYGDDEGLDIIRLDGLQRANAGVGSAISSRSTRPDRSPRPRSFPRRRKTTFACRAHSARSSAVSRDGLLRGRYGGDRGSPAGQCRHARAYPSAAECPGLRAAGSTAGGGIDYSKGIVHIDDNTTVELLPEFTESARASGAPTSPMTIWAA